MDREDFMDIVYSELESDSDNNRANRIIEAADEYAGSVQPEPCEDAVSKEKILKFFDDWMSALDENCHNQSVSDLKIIKRDFENLPPVTPKQRTGKWIPSDSQCGIRCSVCGAPVDDFCHSIDYIDLVYEPNFCPNCGKKMGR